MREERTLGVAGEEPSQVVVGQEHNLGAPGAQELVDSQVVTEEGREELWE